VKKLLVLAIVIVTADVGCTVLDANLYLEELSERRASSPASVSSTTSSSSDDQFFREFHEAVQREQRQQQQQQRFRVEERSLMDEPKSYFSRDSEAQAYQKKKHDQKVQNASSTLQRRNKVVQRKFRQNKTKNHR
jgi:hypothetical protein